MKAPAHWCPCIPSLGNSDAFRECVDLFYPVVQIDSSHMPKCIDAGADESRKAALERVKKFVEGAKNKEKMVDQLLSGDDFRGEPFRIDELIVS